MTRDLRVTDSPGPKAAPTPTTEDLRAALDTLHSTLTPLPEKLITLRATAAHATCSHRTYLTTAITTTLRTLHDFLTTLHPPRHPTPLKTAHFHASLSQLYANFTIVSGAAATPPSPPPTEPLLYFLATTAALQTQTEILRKELTAAVAAAQEALDAARAELKQKEDATATHAAETAVLRSHLATAQNLQKSLTQQLALLEAEKRTLERKAASARERQKQQSQGAAGFFGMFAPVFAPLAMTGGVFAVRVADDQIRVLGEKAAELKEMRDGIEVARLEREVGERGVEMGVLEGGVEVARRGVGERGVEVALCEGMVEGLGGLQGEVAGLRAEAEEGVREGGEGVGTVREWWEAVERCRGEVLQALVTTREMEYKEAVRWCMVGCRTVCRVLAEFEGSTECEEAVGKVEGLFEVGKEDVEVDEGEESDEGVVVRKEEGEME